MMDKIVDGLALVAAGSFVVLALLWATLLVLAYTSLLLTPIALVGVLGWWLLA